VLVANMAASRKGAGMLKEFRNFVTRGNVLDLAVAVMIGGAFAKIVDSLVKDVLMPPIGLVLGNIDFSKLFISLDGKHYESLDAAQKAEAATINYGLFLNNVVSFLIVAFVIFLILKQVSRFQPKVVAPVTEKECPFCRLGVPLPAVRCPHCTSTLQPA
jgi:large conductance mechanosensitive channel